jgi:hypothetical protein
LFSYINVLWSIQSYSIRVASSVLDVYELPLAVFFAEVLSVRATVPDLFEREATTSGVFRPRHGRAG